RRAPPGQRRRALAAVEHEERSAVQAQAVEVAAELRETLGEGIGAAVAPDLELDRPALDSTRIGPTDAEIDPAAPHRVLAIDEAAAVDHPLEEGHEDELRRRLAVGGLGEVRLGVLAPEGAEVALQKIEAQAAVRADVGGAREREGLLQQEGQGARDDLAIDRVGD